MRSSAAALLVLTMLMAGCGGPSHPPAAPPSDGGGVPNRPPPTPHRDSGTDGALADATSPATDAGVSADCVSLPATGNGLALTDTSGAALDFRPTHAVAAWLPSGCDNPTPELLIALGDGCDPLSGDRLVFRVERGALQRGEVFIGFPLFVDDVHPFSVRLVLPPSVGPEPSVWGDCAGATGSITFDDNGWEAGSVESASFDITLTDCSSTPTLADVRASGRFFVTLADAFEDVCTPVL